MTTFETISLVVGCISLPLFLYAISKRYSKDMKEMEELRGREKEEINIHEKKIKLHKASY